MSKPDVRLFLNEMLKAKQTFLHDNGENLCR